MPLQCAADPNKGPTPAPPLPFTPAPPRPHPNRQDLSVLSAACNDNCQCRGFNNYGWLKTAVRPLQPTADAAKYPRLCLYVKIIPPTCSGPGELRWHTMKVHAHSACMPLKWPTTCCMPAAPA